MIAKLLDVFELSGRGCVVALDIESGFCRVGDEWVIGSRPWTITGIEMVSYNAEGLERIKQGWKPPTGVLLRDANKADLSPFIGEAIIGNNLVAE